MGSAFDELTEIARHTLPAILAAHNPEQWITVRFAALILNVSDDYVRKLVAADRVASVKRGRKRLVKLVDILEVQLGDPEVEPVKPNTTHLRRGQGVAS